MVIRHLLREADPTALEAQWADHYGRFAAADYVETNAMAAEYDDWAIGKGTPAPKSGLVSRTPCAVWPVASLGRVKASDLGAA